MKTDLQFKEDSKLIHEYLKAIKKKLRPHTKAEKKYLTELKMPCMIMLNPLATNQ